MEDQMGEAVMPFGRYAGTPFDCLVIEDEKYVHWLLGQSWLDTAIAAQLQTAIAEVQAEREAELRELESEHE
jgi:hypothetical protein